MIQMKCISCYKKAEYMYYGHSYCKKCMINYQERLARWRAKRWRKRDAEYWRPDSRLQMNLMKKVKGLHLW